MKELTFQAVEANVSLPNPPRKHLEITVQDIEDPLGLITDLLDGHAYWLRNEVLDYIGKNYIKEQCNLVDADEQD